ncbi:hypothetical protein VTN96DRAFT_2965 [Rasamsonia emersonii]
MADQLPSVTPPRKRRRPAKSCEQCRRRKIRCDQAVPCGPCVRSRSSLTCSYRSSFEIPDPSHVVSNTPVPAPVRTPQSHPSQVEAEVRTTDRDLRSSLQGYSPSLVSHSNHERTIQDLRQRLQRLEERLSSNEINHTPADPGLAQAVRDLSNRVLRAEQQLSGSHAVQPGPAQTTTADSSIPSSLPRLRISPDKTKLFGQSHWLHTAEKFQIIPKFDAKDVEPGFSDAKAELTSILKDCRNLRHLAKAQQSVKLNDPVPDLLGTIPARAVCDELVHAYLRTFELVYRIVHIPSFWKDYHQFWEHPQSTPTPFLMRLVLMLAIGTAFYPDRGDFERIRRLAQTWIYAAQWWLVGPSEKSTLNLDGLQVFCLLLLARQTNSRGQSTWISAGSLVRMAMAMGLHRDPELFPALSVFQSEMRRRLWATVVELAVQSSLDSAMPLLLSPHDFDTKAPSNIDDKDIDADTKTPPAPKPSHEFTESSIQILLLKSLPLRLEVARRVNDFRQGQSYETAVKLGTELRTACREIAAFFHANMSRQPGRDLGPTDFHRKFLDMYVRRYVLFLHRPFMLDARKDPRFYLSRKVCVESSMVIASYADSLKLPSGEVDDLGRLTIFGRGTFKGALSLDVITVLGLEIITQLEEEAATRPSGCVADDPLDEMAKANRAPFVQRLEHILEQLLQIIELGQPSLKRYNMVAAMLSQIQAMESGQNVTQAVYETVKQSLKKCYSLLQASLAVSTPQSSVEMLTTGQAGFAEFDDPSLDFGISSLLYFPGLAEGSITV